MAGQNADGASLYDFKIQPMRRGETIDLGGETFRGKPVIVVNGASHCGYTKSNYEGLSQLLNKYKDLQVVVFPCNQFMNQERDDPETIACNIANYDPRFHVTELVKVNGSDTTPVFRWLKEAAPGTILNAIKWNFTKFLIDREGHAVRRFAPNEEPSVLEAYIDKLQ
jgi:glutathione peroxidase